MFARDFVDLERPFAEVAHRFVTDTTWLAPLAERAVRSARALTTRLAGPGPAVGPDDRPDGSVRCTAGPVRTAGAGILIPFVIAVAGGADLPRLVGELEVAPVGHRHTQVACNVNYRRPTPAGIRPRVERAVAGGVREFLRGIAEHLDLPVPARPTDRGPPGPP